MTRKDLEKIRDTALEEIAQAQTQQELARIKTKYFGKKGIWRDIERALFSKGKDAVKPPQ